MADEDTPQFIAVQQDLIKSGVLEADADEKCVASMEDFTFGDRVHVLEDDEDNGISEGEEGILLFFRVGAAQYGNVHTAAYILLDGTDTPTPVDLGNVEAVGD